MSRKKGGELSPGLGILESLIDEGRGRLMESMGEVSKIDHVSRRGSITDGLKRRRKSVRNSSGTGHQASEPCFNPVAPIGLAKGSQRPCVRLIHGLRTGVVSGAGSHSRRSKAF